jgi:hypothetical protein
MARRSKDAGREERIHMDIIADADGPEEQAASWYTYLAETLQFPFPATCTALRALSPVAARRRIRRGGYCSGRGVPA